jgi:hypothetical protein
MHSYCFGLLALGAGLVAAWFWYKSTTEMPPEMDRLSTVIRDQETGLTPVESWLADVGTKNRKAAGLTALSVVLGAISNIVGILS